MKEIKISVTEDRVVFTIEGEEYFITLARFLSAVRHNGESIKNDAERIAHRFDELKRLETVSRIDVLRDMGRSVKEIAAIIDFPVTVLEEFLETQGGYLAAMRADPSYPIICTRFKADRRLVEPVEADMVRRPHEPAPPGRPIR